jgi:[acyl-carrier-protein] S-malonyltransferase
VIANSTCEILRDGRAVRAELAQQVTAPVHWVESVRALAGLGPDTWVDSGPGGVVAGLARRILPAIAPLALSTIIDAPEAA